MKFLHMFFLVVFVGFSTQSLARDEVIERPGGNIKDIVPSQESLTFDEFLKTVKLISNQQKQKSSLSESVEKE